MSESKLRRYNIEYSNTGITPELSDDGAWVRVGDAKRAIAAERERCAKLCEDMSAYTGGHGEPSAPTGDRYAAAIRRGKTP